MRNEIHRQFIHYIGGNAGLAILALSAIYKLDKTIPLSIFIALFLIGLFISQKLQKGHSLPLFSALIKHVERPAETQTPGKPALLFLLGAILTTALFEIWPAIIGLIVLTYGDSVSTLIGKYRGRLELVSDRTLEGTLAGILAAIAVLQFIIPQDKAIGIGVIGMLAEYLPVDDNLGIPLVGALAATLLL